MMLPRSRSGGSLIKFVVISSLLIPNAGLIVTEIAKFGSIEPIFTKFVFSLVTIEFSGTINLTLRLGFSYRIKLVKGEDSDFPGRRDGL
jgi:hypothetical protein